MDKKFDLSLLQAFVVAAEAPSQASAARELGITQPTLSYLMNKLSDQVETPLFQKEGKRNVLTRYGKAVKEAAQRHFKEFESSLDEIDRHYASTRMLPLRIGCRVDRVSWIRRLIKYTGQIDVRDLSSDNALKALQNHEIDIAIVHDRPTVPDVITHKLFRSGHRFIVHPDLLEGRRLSECMRDPQFLEEHPALQYRRNEPVLEHWLKMHDVDLKKVVYRLTCSNWGTVVRWVGEGDGYAVIPSDFYPKDFGMTDLAEAVIPESELPGLTYYAAYFPELKKVPGFAQSLKLKSE